MEPVDEALNINDDNLATLLDKTDQANAEDMFELFIQYREAGDEAEAHKWLRKAADQGHCRALAILGTYVDEDKRLAHELKAAEIGCVGAQYTLGLWYLHYLHTEYVQKDYAQAAFWLTKAAEQGDMDAQLKLGKMYLKGQGVPQDDNVAVAWIRKSTEQEHEWAYYQLGMMCLDGQGVSQSDEEAAAWFLKAAKLEDFDATYQMGVMYLEGRGVPQDNEQACYWIRKSAEMGDSDAQALLGEMLELGQGTPRNLGEVAEWLAKAAARGDEDAQIRLDRILRSGVLDKRDQNRNGPPHRDPHSKPVLH